MRCNWRRKKHEKRKEVKKRMKKKQQQKSQRKITKFKSTLSLDRRRDRWSAIVDSRSGRGNGSNQAEGITGRGDRC